MTAIVKRGIRQTWRQSVLARGGAPAAARYDALVGEGRAEAEAAYRALEALELLWDADEPGGEPPGAAPGDDPPAL